MTEMIENVTDNDVKVLFGEGGVCGEEFSQGEHTIIRSIYKEYEHGEGIVKTMDEIFKARLPYRTEELDVAVGKRPLVYRDIPDKDKKALFAALFMFADCPKMDDMVLDIHEGKLFRFGDAMIIREPWNGYNYLVSPYYAVSGGMAVDIVKDSVEGIEVKDEDGGDEECTR